MTVRVAASSPSYDPPDRKISSGSLAVTLSVSFYIFPSSANPYGRRDTGYRCRECVVASGSSAVGCRRFPRGRCRLGGGFIPFYPGGFVVIGTQGDGQEPRRSCRLSAHLPRRRIRAQQGAVAGCRVLSGYLLDASVVSMLALSRTDASAPFLDWLERIPAASL